MEQFEIRLCITDGDTMEAKSRLVQCGDFDGTAGNGGWAARTPVVCVDSWQYW